MKNLFIGLLVLVGLHNTAFASLPCEVVCEAKKYYGWEFNYVVSGNDKDGDLLDRASINVVREREFFGSLYLIDLGNAKLSEITLDQNYSITPGNGDYREIHLPWSTSARDELKEKFRHLTDFSALKKIADKKYFQTCELITYGVHWGKVVASRYEEWEDQAFKSFQFKPLTVSIVQEDRKINEMTVNVISGVEWATPSAKNKANKKLQYLKRIGVCKP